MKSVSKNFYRILNLIQEIYNNTNQLIALYNCIKIIEKIVIRTQKHTDKLTFIVNK